MLRFVILISNHFNRFCDLCFDEKSKIIVIQYDIHVISTEKHTSRFQNGFSLNACIG